jgi:hypothetical protein
MGRKKHKSSVSISVSRPHLANVRHIPVARSVHIHRQKNGRLGSSSSYALSHGAQVDFTSGGDDGGLLHQTTDLDCDADFEIAPTAGTGDIPDQEDGTNSEQRPPPVRSAFHSSCLMFDVFLVSTCQ